MKKTKKIIALLFLALFLFAGAFLSVSYFFNQVLYEVNAAVDSEVVDVNLDVQATIGNTCSTPVNMGAIVGTGQSALATNETTCTVITNNSAGYNLTFTSATTYMENATSDQIAAYTPAVAGTPDIWSVATTASEWGARLKSTSTTYDTKWGTAGTDTYAAKWHNVTNSGLTVVSRATETTSGGDSEIIQFGAEVGSSKFQPTGTYDVDVTITATTN